MGLKLKQGSGAPSTKVQVGVAMMSTATIVCFFLKRAGIEVDADTALAIATVLTFGAQYLTRPTRAPRDQVVLAHDDGNG